MGTHQTEQEAREAYQTDLDICFIVRMPRALREQIEAHRDWMRFKYRRKTISLAAASRDLFRRGLILSPPEQHARRKAARSGQLSLFGGGCQTGPT